MTSSLGRTKWDNFTGIWRKFFYDSSINKQWSQMDPSLFFSNNLIISMWGLEFQRWNSLFFITVNWKPIYSCIYSEPRRLLFTLVPYCFISLAFLIGLQLTFSKVFARLKFFLFKRLVLLLLLHCCLQHIWCYYLPALLLGSTAKSFGFVTKSLTYDGWWSNFGHDIFANLAIRTALMSKI